MIADQPGLCVDHVEGEIRRQLGSRLAPLGDGLEPRILIKEDGLLAGQVDRQAVHHGALLVQGEAKQSPTRLAGPDVPPLLVLCNLIPHALLRLLRRPSVALGDVIISSGDHGDADLGAVMPLVNVLV